MIPEPAPNMRIQTTLILLLAIQPLSASDSLSTVISHTQGVSRVEARLEYAAAVAKTNFEAAVEQAQLAITEATEIDDQVLLAKALFQLSLVYVENQDNKHAEMYLNQALPLGKNANEHELNSRIQLELGKICTYRGDNYKAIEYFSDAILDAEKVDNYRIMGTCNSSIGSRLRVLGAYEKSLEFTIRARSNYELANFGEGTAWIDYTIGRLYRDLGVYEEAEASFNESLSFYTSQAESNGDSIGIALCLDQLGLIQLAQKKPELAEKLIRRSLKIYDENQSAYGISNAWKNLGKIEYAMENYSEAKAVLQESLYLKLQAQDIMGIPGIYEYLGLALIAGGQWQAGIDSLMIGLERAKISEQRQIQYNIYGHLASAFEDVGKVDESLKYYKLRYGLNEVISQNPAHFKLPELRGIYEMEKSRQQIKGLEQTNEIFRLQLNQQRLIQWVLIIGGLGLVVFLGLLLNQFNRIRSINRENENLIKQLQGEITAREKAETERLALESQMRQSQKLESLGNMVNGLAHEFNNVLQNIFLYGGILQEQLPDEKSKTNLKIMLDESERARKIVSQIMTFSRQTEAKIKAHDLAPILSDVIDLWESNKAPGVTLVKEIRSDCMPARCNPNQLQEIIINVCNNAQEAMPQGGQLTISLGEIKSSALPLLQNEDADKVYLALVISDTGRGMDNKTLEKIFDPFFTTKDVGEGTGLGLSVVHGLVEQMGGHISATSKLGEGSIIRIFLPTSEA